MALRGYFHTRKGFSPIHHVGRATKRKAATVGNRRVQQVELKVNQLGQ